MEKITLKAILELAGLDKNTLNTALLMIACVFFYYQWMAADGRAVGKEIEMKKLNQQIYQSQIEERQRERDYQEAKFNAIIKERENCEIEKQNIYKKFTSNAGKNNK